MTYGHFLAGVLRENRKYLIFCITFSILCSMLCFGGVPSARAVDPDTVGFVESMGGSFGEKIGPVISTGYFGGVDTSWIMIIMSASSLGAAAGRESGIAGLDKLSGFSFGIFENRYICYFMLAWFGIPILLKAFSKTNALGTSIEMSQKKINGVVIMIVTLSQLISSSEPKALVRASRARGFLGTGLNVLVCIVVLLVTLVVYILVRYLFALMDIVLVPVCTFVPFVSFLIVFSKLAILWIMILFAIYIPWFFFIVFAVIVLVSALLFRTAYMAVRYFEKIYVKALFKRIFGGFDPNMPILAKKLPEKVSSFLKGRNVQMVIPVYVLKTFPGIKGMRKWDRFWMVSEQGVPYLIKPVFGKKECMQVPLYNNPAQKMFINAFLPYYEIFNIYGSEEAIVKTFKKVPKMCHIVFSKEYFHRYQEIKYLTGFVDYAEYREYLKSFTMQPGMQGMPGGPGFPG